MENFISIKLESDVVTGEAVAQFVNSILEFLLYQRNQIPFVYKTFKYLVSKWDKNDNNEDVPINFQLERQKNLAKQTMDCIKLMEEVVRKSFLQSEVSRVRFLFGSTAVTPKEAYTIYIPTISKEHSYEHHMVKAAALNQALISLLTAECLYKTFSTNLSPTNVFLELEMPDSDAENWDQIVSTDLCDLPTNCKEVVINLVHEAIPDSQTKCCRELTIFQDFSNLSVCNDNELVEPKTDAKSKTVGWWEATTIVRGFKQTTSKANNLWQ